MWGFPSQSPNSLPHHGSPGMGGYGKGRASMPAPEGVQWDGNGLHATQPPCCRLRAAGEARGAPGAPHPSTAGKGRSEPRGQGGTGTVLTTADMSSSVLRQPQDAGRGKEESAAVGIPTASAAPPMSHPLPLLLRQGHPNCPRLRHILPPSLPACWRLSGFEKHQGCLQKQLKNVSIDHLTPSSFFFQVCLSTGVWGHLMGTPNPMSSPSAISSQTILIWAEVSAQLWPGGQPARAFTAFYFYCPVTPKVFPKLSSLCCSSPEPVAGCKAGPRASRHLSDTVWVKHLVPMREGGGRSLPSSSLQCPTLPLAGRSTSSEPRLCEGCLAPAQPPPRTILFPTSSRERDGHPFFPATKSNPSLGGARLRDVSDAVISGGRSPGYSPGREKAEPSTEGQCTGPRRTHGR